MISFDVKPIIKARFQSEEDAEQFRSHQWKGLWPRMIYDHFAEEWVVTLYRIEL